MDIALISSFASASLQVVLEKVTTLAITEVGFIRAVDDELKKLQRTLFRIQALLDDAEDKQISDMAWRIWLLDLKDMAYDADDLIDEIAIEVSRLKLEFQSDRNQVRNLVHNSFKFTTPHTIIEIREKLEDIAKEMDSIYLRELTKGRQLNHIIERRTKQSSSLTSESHVFGREKDKEEIIKKLFTPEESNGSYVSVISIVGMAGLGKTTLAQIVYNDANVNEHFPLRMWVSVSHDFDVRRLTRSMIEVAIGQTFDLLDLDPLQVRLREVLEGKKFLLVLDDLWNEKHDDWDVLRAPLRAGAEGSKILVTTRSQIVSSMVETTIPTHYLQCLSEENCWSLFKQRALGNKNLDAVANLVVVGKEIVRKCKGLPLAAKTLGSLLHFKVDENEWNVILESKMWELPEDKNDVLSALRLSYHHLPTHLKQCFAYCSIFPQNYEFEKDNLVQMWMAEGFIQPKGMRRMEEIGNNYFDDLFWRSFFQCPNMNIQSKYKMHDLVHDLAHLVSSDKCFRMEENDNAYTSCISKYARYSSLLCENILPMTFEAFYKCEGLRTFLLLRKYGTLIQEVPSDLFLKLGRLRVLNLSHTHIIELSYDIGNLKHLRYLDLSKTHIKRLPESTGKLYGLQILKLEGCSEFLQLPKNMKNLTNLRHLYLDVKRQLSSMPLGIGNLTNLQTLIAFIVGRESGYRIEELKDMKNLRGSICILKLENVENVREANEAMLNNKQYLDKLELQWSRIGNEGAVEQEVLAGLEPHKNIRELKVVNYSGIIFPSWIGNPSFSKLGSISLYNCRNCIHLPPLGQLPMLKSLDVAEVHGVKYVDEQFCGEGVVEGFPSLETLEFHGMPNLCRWSGVEDSSMPHLRELTIFNCPELITLPSLHYLTSLQHFDINRCSKLPSLPEERQLPLSLESLIITNCPILKERCKEEGEDWQKIQHIPYIEIDCTEISRNNV